ncbi:MAG: formylmethanofuran dehydrogenase subunit A [Caldiserica bacterium]|nr:formylmethanofuran dehydrogenase subunit A [Caldisericota bacterium]
MIRIIGGKLYDPINSINGKKTEIWVNENKIFHIGELQGVTPDIVLDARNCIIFPGGIDIHAHIAGSGVNLARKLVPEDHRRAFLTGKKETRSGVGYSIPSTFFTGYQYAMLGYTLVMEAAMPILTAAQTHRELEEIPILDTGAYTLMGNNLMLLDLIEKEDLKNAKRLISFLLKTSRGFAIKLVNPCRVLWGKLERDSGNTDSMAIFPKIVPKKLIAIISEINEDLKIPSPVHLHCNEIGLPGNFQITLDSLEAAGENRLHLSHLGFHCYGGKNWNDFHSKTYEIIRYLDEHKNISFDVGQIAFGDTTTISADTDWQYFLFRESKGKWINFDLEGEEGFGIIPYSYRMNNMVNCIQWAIGLELMLLSDDPWRACLSTDHPNGAPFYFYPQIIKLLQSKTARDEFISKFPDGTKERIHLHKIKREYTLNEIAIVSRVAASQILGLKQKGSLGVGCDADIAIYREDSDPEKMFSSVKHLLKGGEIIIEDGKLRKSTKGKTIFVDPGKEEEIQNFLEMAYEVLFSKKIKNMGIPDYLRSSWEKIKC